MTKKKIEEKNITVEKKKSPKKKTNATWENIIAFCDHNRQLLIGLAIGLLIGLGIMVITEDEEIAKLKDGTEPVVTLKDTTITANDLYKDMKDYYSVSILVDEIDKLILNDLYKEDDNMNTSINGTITSYQEYYGENLLSTLQSNGIKSLDEFKEVLKLDYRRNLAFEEYVKSLVTDEEINDYYEKKVYGDINTEHMLVKVETTDEMTDDEKNNKKTEALNLAKEIINKLNEGKSFEEVKEEYKDKITYEKLGFQAYNASLETSYKDASAALENGAYSKSPVETSYGYHIIHRIENKEKPTLETVKDSVINELATEKKSADTKLYYKALFNLREKNELSFVDSVLNDKYIIYKDYYLKNN